MTSKTEGFTSSLSFENAVSSLLAKAAVTTYPPRARGYDFLIEKNGRKILIEVKDVRRRMPARLIAHIAERLRQLVQQEGAVEAIIVTPSPIQIPPGVLGEGQRFMTLRDLKKYLDSGETRPTLTI